MDSPLARVLEATGFLEGGRPAAPTVVVDPAGQSEPNRIRDVRTPSFRPGAWWRSDGEPSQSGFDVGLRVYFKFVEDMERAPINEWQREVWNQGFAPLLWVVSPEHITLYNGFGVPSDSEDENRLRTFRLVDEELERLDALAGRLVLETGQVWRHIPEVDRRTGVDARLLRQLGSLEDNLAGDGLPRPEAQALIGRSIFMQYLVDGGRVDEEALQRLAGHSALPSVFNDREATIRLFAWLRDRFNGDMFPGEPVPDSCYLRRIGEFLAGTDPASGQMSFFPYRFDVIPVEMISVIYEQFVHSSKKAPTDSSEKERRAEQSDAFYTPLTAVSLVLDEVLSGCNGEETVLDLTCGSGVFLVEALRRLVHLQARRAGLSRDLVRRVLYRQIRGVDISAEAIRVAAFSLYLAALELDPDPAETEGSRFRPLIGQTLLVGDAFTTEPAERPVDVIVGNPPWSFKGADGTATRRARGELASPRGESFDFVRRALELGHENTRLGMVVSATPFFSLSATGIRAAQEIVGRLAPVTLVNLSALQGWLFPKATMPAMVLLSNRAGSNQDQLMLVNVPWSPTGKKSRMIEVGPSDVAVLPVSAWRRKPDLLKAGFLGNRQDVVLLDELTDRSGSLGRWLDSAGAPLRSGLAFGDRSNDASHLKDLSFVRRGIEHFALPSGLSAFRDDRAERPRRRETYSAPLVLVGQNLRKIPRLVSVVSEHDVVFTESYYGASFRRLPVDVAYLVAGILGSGLASWYVLMTGSAFGLWKRRIKRGDIRGLPVPELGVAAATAEGRRVVEVARGIHRRQGVRGKDWQSLDEAVYDLYGLDEADRVVVRDGIARAAWQWKNGRCQATAAADTRVLWQYAEVFLRTMDEWLSGRGQRRMRAEIVDFDEEVPLRIVRFVLEDQSGPSTRIETVDAKGPLGTVLRSIGEKARVRVAEALVGVRDLRVHAGDEVAIIKPAASRNWLRVNALEDADAVVNDSLSVLRTSS